MKAATGEVNLTVITVVAIAAVVAFFMGVLWPKISNSIKDQAKNTATCTKYDSNGKCIASNAYGW